jgi:hypothetical protein
MTTTRPAGWSDAAEAVLDKYIEWANEGAKNYWEKNASKEELDSLLIKDKDHFFTWPDTAVLGDVVFDHGYSRHIVMSVYEGDEGGPAEMFATFRRSPMVLDDGFVLDCVVFYFDTHYQFIWHDPDFTGHHLCYADTTHEKVEAK